MSFSVTVAASTKWHAMEGATLSGERSVKVVPRFLSSHFYFVLIGIVGLYWSLFIRDTFIPETCLLKNG